MSKLAIIPCFSLGIFLQQGPALAIGLGKYIDSENPPAAVHIKEAKPLDAETSYFDKFDRFTDAIDDNDFHRSLYYSPTVPMRVTRCASSFWPTAFQNGC